MVCAVVLCCLVFPAVAQTESPDSVADQEVLDNAGILMALDSLTNCMFEGCLRFNDSAYVADHFDRDTIVPVFEDSVIAKKMQFIPAAIDLSYNRFVKAYIKVYSDDKRDHVEQILGLSELYFPIFEQELDRRGMPMELKYLPVVESALNPNAVSKVGATGLWQIMYATGRYLHLNINSYVDERRDPYKSTDAALNYLQQLYDTYNDWLLVIAAYNCGPGNVNKAIRRSGGKHTFWEIRNYLPRETRGYVPAFIAATYVLHYHDDFNLVPIPTGFSFNTTDTVMVHEKVSLQRIADKTGADYLELIYLNPALKLRVIPKLATGYPLVLPINKMVAFETYRDSIFLPIAPDDVVAELPEELDPYKGFAKLTYTVKPGDNLGYIAEWYDCSARDIREWNGMYGNTIRAGAKLAIYVPSHKYDRYKQVEYLSFSQKQAIEHGAPPVTEPTVAVTDGSCDGCIIYVVKPGDTLWDISKRYPGVSIDDIKRTNNITDSRTLKPGMKLKIKI